MPTKHLLKKFKNAIKHVEELGISIKDSKDVALETITDLLAKEFVCSKEVIQKRLLKEGLTENEKS